MRSYEEHGSDVGDARDFPLRVVAIKRFVTIEHASNVSIAGYAPLNDITSALNAAALWNMSYIFPLSARPI